MLQTLLDSINQTEGVQGSWLSDPTGQTLVKAVSVFHSEELLQRTAKKVVQMAQTQNTYLGGSDEIFMKFESVAIYVRSSATCMILVILDPSMNIEGLRVATHLVLQRFGEIGMNPQPAQASSGMRLPSLDMGRAPVPGTAPRPAPPAQRPSQPPTPPKKKSGIWG